MIRRLLFGVLRGHRGAGLPEGQGQHGEAKRVSKKLVPLKKAIESGLEAALKGVHRAG